MNKSDNETSIPYDPSNVTTLGDDLFQIADKVPFFTYSIIMISFSIVAAYILFAIFLFVDYNWLLDNMCFYFGVITFVFGIIILIGLISSISVLKNISGKIKPIRLKMKLELFPVIGNDPIIDLFQRLMSCFLLGDRNREKYINQEINKNGKHYLFNIYYNKIKYIFLYIFIISFVFSFLLLLLLDAFMYSNINKPIEIGLLIVFIIEFLIFNIMMLVKILYVRDIIIIKFFSKKIKIKDIIIIKEEYESFVTKNSKPLLLGIVSSGGFNTDVIKYVQDQKGKAHNKHQISLIEYKNDSFKLIWT